MVILPVRVRTWAADAPLALDLGARSAHEVTMRPTTIALWARRLASLLPVAVVAFAAGTTRGAPDPGPASPAVAPCAKGEAPSIDPKTGRPSCVAAAPPSACGLPAADAGPCKAAIPRWTYDAATGACRRFVYGGCGGNANNFETQEACERGCEPDPCTLPAKRAGACSAALSRWSYDASSRTCEPFVYSGCGGNANNFETRAECARRCPVACACPRGGRPVCGVDRRTYPSRCEADCKGVTVAAEGECSAVISMCSLASEPGPCKAAIPRWYYRPATGACERFVYGGCGGNANNFETREACVKSCAP